jgi:CIC family chloride channel protein
MTTPSESPENTMTSSSIFCSAHWRVAFLARPQKPQICAVCGLVAWWLPGAAGGGHVTAERLLSGQWSPGLAALALLLVAQFALTLVSYGSGAPGGIFAPMLLLGAISGSIVGGALALGFPALAPHATAFAVLGMAALFTGSVRAPLTGIVLIVEMTGNYQQLLALGVTCLVADLVAGALRDRPIYEALLEADLRQRPSAAGTAPEVSEPRSVYIGVQRGSALEGQPIRKASLPPGCLVVAVERAGREVLPEADLVLLPGDHLTVLVPSDEAEKAIALVRLATGV